MLLIWLYAKQEKKQQQQQQQHNKPDRMLDEACVGYCFNFRCPNY